ncbi:tRNA (guanine-N(1)-)-methyltransferase [compost metagenome]
MSKFVILTLFPEMFKSFTETSMIKRLIEKDQLNIELVDIRDFSKSKHNKVDDTPYGGGSGMVMMCEPLDGALNYAISNINDSSYKIIYLSPRGRLLNYNVAKEYSTVSDNYILVCGHYEGIDERIIEKYSIEEVSIGDYVLTGGELPAMVFVDSVIRLKPNVLSEGSLDEESHTNLLLEYPQYTKPSVYEKMTVPDVLISGDHKKIHEYRKNQSVLITNRNRPDLLKKAIDSQLITKLEVDKIIEEKGGK